MNKEQKAPKVRGTEDLKKSTKGKIILVARKAKAFADKNDFKGIPSLESVEYPGGKLYRVTKKDGSLSKMDENSDEFKKLKSLAKAAASDLVSESEKKEKGNPYTKNVQDFLEALANVTSPRGSRGVNIEDLKDLEL